MPLPASPYETAVLSTTTIQPVLSHKNRRLQASVPYKFIGKKVDIRATENSIEVFYHNNRIALHVRRSYSLRPIYVPKHMSNSEIKHRQFSGLGKEC